MVALGQLLHGQKLRTEKVVRMVRTHRHTDRQTDRHTHTHRLLHVNFFGHAEVDASGLTFLQSIIKNVHTYTVITLQVLLTPACNNSLLQVKGLDDQWLTHGVKH